MVGSHDTPIEMRLRALLLRWAKSRGAAVTTRATAVGDRADLRFPADLAWSLEPQVMMGGVQPDFLLTCRDPEVPRVAVFCDSVRWHTSAHTNAVAADTGKRTGLRDSDVLVWAVTHQDLDAFAAVLDGAAPTSGAWCSGVLRARFLQVAQRLAAPGSVRPDVLTHDPLSALTAFLLQPDRSAWRAPAHALGIAFSAGTLHPMDAGFVPDLLRAELTGALADVPPGDVRVAVGRTARGAPVAVERRSLHDVRAWVGVDDADGVVGTDAQIEMWRDWLAVGNVLQFLPPGRFHAVSGSTPSPGGAAQEALTVPWKAVIDVSEPGLRPLLVALAATAVPMPEPGLEVEDGEYTLDLAWPGQRLAVLLGDGEDGLNAWMAEHGWTLLPPDADAVRTALRGGRG